MPTPVTFQHWAGVRPYATSCEFAGSCVFSKQSPLARFLAKVAPLLPRIRGQFAEFLWRHSLEAWVYSTSPLASALVQSAMSPATTSAARRRFQAAGRGGRVASGAVARQYAARLTHRPLSRRCRPRGWVLLRSKGHGATFGPSAGGIDDPPPRYSCQH